MNDLQVSKLERKVIGSPPPRPTFPNAQVTSFPTLIKLHFNSLLTSVKTCNLKLLFGWSQMKLEYGHGNKGDGHCCKQDKFLLKECDVLTRKPLGFNFVMQRPYDHSASAISVDVIIVLGSLI